MTPLLLFFLVLAHPARSAIVITGHSAVLQLENADIPGTITECDIGPRVRPVRAGGDVLAAWNMTGRPVAGIRWACYRVA